MNQPEEEGAWLETNGERHNLRGTCSLGRAAANTIVLDLPKVSRMHALIQLQNIGEFWLVDEGLESSLPDGAALATRLFTPEGFAMTAGVLVPLDIELIEYAIADTPQLLRNRREELIDDRRFAEAIYRVALASGLMEQVAYQDPVSGAA